MYGAERVMLDLCVECQAIGASVMIGSIGVPGCGEKDVERAARERGIPVSAVRMAPGPSLRGLKDLVALAREYHADVIHAHGYKPDILFGLLPRRLRRAPLVITVHGYTSVSWFDRVALYSALDLMALRRADAVVLVHDGMRRQPGLWSLPRSSCRVIENGIPARERTEVAWVPDADLAKACEGRWPIIGAVGRLSAEKSFDVLLRASAEVLNRHPSGLLLILGDGPERESLKRTASRLGLSDRILLPGYLEAMQAELPIVATRVGGVPEVLDHGGVGLLVEPGNVRELTEAIHRCIVDRELARKLASAAHARAELRFSSRVMAERYLAVYQELVYAGRLQ
jgi:glycosyltransferase involved in cell wall biosynthesis